jgi:hypothetical protein
VRRFVNGILVGSLLGGMLGLFANNNFKPQRKNLMRRTKKMSKQASRVLGEVTHDFTRLMKKR